MVATIAGTLEGFMLPFVKHFRDLGWQVDGLASEVDLSDRCIQAFNNFYKISWARNPLDPKNFLQAPSRVREVVIQGGYDLVHVHTPIASFITRYALKEYWDQPKRPQIFYTTHGFHFHANGSPVTNAIYRKMESIAGQWTDCLITINEDDRLAAEKYKIVPTEKIQYTPGIGVDTSFYDSLNFSDQAKQEIRSELTLKDSDTLLLGVAEFTPNKKHSDQLKALKLLNRSDIHLAFAGEGPAKSETEKLSVELGLQNQVHFLGFRSDIPLLLSVSDSMILTSEREGLPRSILEAFCLATPVIGSNIRGIKDLLADDCGILVNYGDVNALAKAMSCIADNKDKAKAMGQKGKSKIGHYDIKQIVAMYDDFYRQALA